MKSYTKLNIKAFVAFAFTCLLFSVIHFIVISLGGTRADFFLIAACALMIDIISSFGIDARNKARREKITEEVETLMAFRKLEGKL